MSQDRMKKRPAANDRNGQGGSGNLSSMGSRKGAPATRRRRVDRQNASDPDDAVTRMAVRVAKSVEGSRTLVRSRSAHGTPAETGADMVVSGLAINAVTAQKFAQFRSGHVELAELLETLNAAVERVNGGDLRGTKALLTAQATTLNAIFNHLATLALQTDLVDKFDRYLRLGLKAQAQSRATLETVAAIQQPRRIVAQQANIAHGPQQVNNQVAANRREADPCADAPDGAESKRGS